MGRAYKSWTTGEIEDLRYLRTVERLRIKEIAEILERSERTIEEATHRYGIRIEEPWKEQELELLKKLVFDTGNKKKRNCKETGQNGKCSKKQNDRNVREFRTDKTQKRKLFEQGGSKIYRKGNKVPAGILLHKRCKGLCQCT